MQSNKHNDFSEPPYSRALNGLGGLRAGLKVKPVLLKYNKLTLVTEK